MPNAPSYFQNSENVIIKGGNFNTISGGEHYYIQGDYNYYNESGLNCLSRVIAHGAIHDSSERSPPPNCHPETRKEVLKLILDWIDEPNPSYSVLWLYGPAGAGKTAILQSIAELLNSNSPTESSRKSGGSFFFSKGKVGRDKGCQLFSTIAYQLAMNLPSLRGHVNKIMESDLIIHKKNMKAQFNSLIVEAFRRLTQEEIDLLHTPTVIIDGLDECEGHEIQQTILLLISQANLPLRFLIASRPEAHIRESFGQANLFAITRPVSLDNSFNPDEDIRLFLRRGFDDIYTRNRHLIPQISNTRPGPSVIDVINPNFSGQFNRHLMSQTPDAWPGESIIDLLVKNSSGQFIYAATVLKFVGAESSHPVTQLEIVLAPNHSHSTEIFSDLDNLYAHILSACRDPKAVIQVLGVILAVHCYQSSEVIEDILGMKRGEAALVLRGLHSLIHFPRTHGERYGPQDERSRKSLWLLHASFHDYLVDKRRSGRFFVNVAEFRTQLTAAGFKLITGRILHPPMGEPLSQRPCLDTWSYLNWHLAPHFAACPKDIREDIIEDLEAFQRKFPMIMQNKVKCRIGFDALHCAMTVLIHMVFGVDYHMENITWEPRQYRTLNNFLDAHPCVMGIATIYYQYRAILDQCYTSFAAYSGADISTLTHLINTIPGFLVQRTGLSVDAIAELSSVDPELVKDLLERNEPFITPESPHLFSLNEHVSDFLLDESRSGRFHIRPSFHHAVMCCHASDVRFQLPDRSKYSYELRSYLLLKYYAHLDFDICIEELVEGHPTSRFLNQLDNIIFYGPDLQDVQPGYLSSIWDAINDTLQWLQRQQQLFDSDCDLQERLRRITDRIYGQILAVEPRSRSTNGEENVGMIILCPSLDEVVTGMAHVGDTRPEHERTRASFFQKISDADVIPERLIISDHFLLLPEIIPSLTEYLTNVKRAGRLYISPDKYHTQLAEYCLEMCPSTEKRPYVRLPIVDKLPDRDGEDYYLIRLMLDNMNAAENWQFHLVRASPSECIFARLRVITLSDCSIQSFKDVIKWLEGLPEPPLDVYIRWQMEFLKKEEEEREIIATNDESENASSIRTEIDLCEGLPSKRQMGYYDYCEERAIWILNLVGWMTIKDGLVFLSDFFSHRISNN